jgi:hypothetical protein
VQILKDGISSLASLPIKEPGRPFPAKEPSRRAFARRVYEGEPGDPGDGTNSIWRCFIQAASVSSPRYASGTGWIIGTRKRKTGHLNS